jgi:hypothetical protein
MVIRFILSVSNVLWFADALCRRWHQTVLRQFFLQFLMIRVRANWSVPILSTVEADSVGIGKVPFPAVFTFLSREGPRQSDGRSDDEVPEPPEGG